MTNTLPSGEGAPGGADPDGSLESDSAPTTGLEPDTAQSGDEPDARSLGDPALDNEQEMRQAGAELQSSREKSSTARDISDRLTAATRPETAQGERP